MKIIDNFFTQAKLYKRDMNRNKIKDTLKKNHTEKSIRILIVEDETTTRETFAAILKDHGYKVDTAKDGYEAIERVEKKSFDIALIDIILGEFNGVETLKVLKEINPHIICIMMTAYTVEDIVEEALKEGARTCIYKPFEVDEMVGLIEIICDRKVH